MQVEMERGGRLFFDLFVAMCNHMVSSYSITGWFVKGKDVRILDLGEIVVANLYGFVG
jgi:hypothetical protein